MGSYPQVISSNPQVTSSNPRVRRLEAPVVRLKVRVRRLKARAEAIKPRVKCKYTRKKKKSRVQNIKRVTKYFCFFPFLLISLLSDLRIKPHAKHCRGAHIFTTTPL